MFRMKEKIFILCFLVSLCGGAYGYDVIDGHTIVGGPGDLSGVPSGADIIINNGGTYSFSVMDSVAANTIRINFDMYGGGLVQNTILTAGDDFDGILNTEFINDIDNLQIELTSGFLNMVSGNDVVHFTDFKNNGGFINIISGDDSGIYDYEFGTCSGGVGKCIIRKYSAAYQNTLHERRLATKGVKNNPKMLLRPIGLVGRHELLGYYEFSDEFFMSIIPEYYNAKGLQSYGVRLNSGTKIGGRLSVGASVHITKANFHNDVSEFESDVYGGNLRFNYDFNEMLFVRGTAGVAFSDIDCDGVKKGEATVDNPHAFGAYGGIDFGARFNFDSGVFVSPFVGYDMQYGTVVDVRENNSFLHIGNDVGFKYFMDGVSYSYVLRLGLNSDGGVDAGIGVGIGSVSDKISGAVSFGVIDTDFGLSGKLSASIRFVF